MTPAAALLGRINDIDSHEMIPTSLWGEAFGPAGAMMASMWESMQLNDTDPNSLVVKPDGDTLVVSPETVWSRTGWVSGCSAPGAIDMARRLEVLDFMGVRRQFVFPTGPMAAYTLLISSPDFLKTLFGDTLDLSALDWDMMTAFARTVLTGWNDWTIQLDVDADRLRPVGLLVPDTVEATMAEAGRLISGGVRAILIPASTPPCGLSPADRAIDPFWQLCAESNTTVILHVAAENLFRSTAWRQIPEFTENTGASTELILDPWSFATSHMAAETYLITAILGGVFERHPALRFGVIEWGAHWIGPMMENLDRWAAQFKRRFAGVLSMPPSGYVKRNIRASAFTFEPVATYIERYGLEDVLCYGSDYPHFEGGTDQLERFLAMVAPLGDDVTEKFFVSNAEWLLA
jgi:predicted TIM-barrel fold metal-dependent hydrolase